MIRIVVMSATYPDRAGPKHGEPAVGPLPRWLRGRPASELRGTPA